MYIVSNATSNAILLPMPNWDFLGAKLGTSLWLPTHRKICCSCHTTLVGASSSSTRACNKTHLRVEQLQSHSCSDHMRNAHRRICCQPCHWSTRPPGQLTNWDLFQDSKVDRTEQELPSPLGRHNICQTFYTSKLSNPLKFTPQKGPLLIVHSTNLVFTLVSPRTTIVTWDLLARPKVKGWKHPQTSVVLLYFTMYTTSPFPLNKPNS